MWWCLIFLFALTLPIPAPAKADELHAPCAAEALCETPLGKYGLAVPPDYPSPVPAVLFFHGWGSSAENVLRNPRIRDPIVSRGYLLIVPQGERPAGGGNRSWSHQGSPHQGRDEIAFVHEILEDVAGRFPLDRRRILVTGFSQGGSMVWHLACFDAGSYRAFAPISGAFWEPAPRDCRSGSVDLFHVHGFTDRVVPLEGRRIAKRWHQADLFAGLAVLRRTDGCPSQPDEFRIENGFRCRFWTGCASGSIRLCLHDGGHRIPAGWMSRILNWFESLP